MYTQPRPDWAGYGHPAPHGLPAGYAVSSAQTPTSAAPAGQRPGQVSDLFGYLAIYDVIYNFANPRTSLKWVVEDILERARRWKRWTRIVLLSMAAFDFSMVNEWRLLTSIQS